jgi:hypothetical protein
LLVDFLLIKGFASVQKCSSYLTGYQKSLNVPDTILEEDHPMTFPSKVGSN